MIFKMGNNRYTQSTFGKRGGSYVVCYPVPHPTSINVVTKSGSVQQLASSPHGMKQRD